jgi:putative ABC transport system permease protein
MEDFLDDLASAWRDARRRPFTAALIVLTLGLGIGANSAMFSVAYRVLLAPLPYDGGDRLVRIEQNEPAAHLHNTTWSVPTFLDYRSQTSSYEQLSEYHRMSFTLLGHGDPHLVQTGVVNWHYFDMLGIRPLLGRGFVDSDERLGAEPTILLSHGFWVERFGADPNVVGTVLEMNNAAHKVIGVLPVIPPFPDENDIWITWSSCPFRSSDQVIGGRQIPMLPGVFAKLREGVSMDAANRELEVVASRLVAEHPDTYAAGNGHATSLRTVKSEMVGDSTATFVLLLGVAVLVVLIASANVANLNLARMAARSQELAIRGAIGATPSRLVRLVLTESVAYALAGGLAGLLVAYPCLGLLSRLAERYTPLATEIGMDGTVLLFALGVAMLTGILSGSAAAFTRRDINRALKEGGDKTTASSTGKRRREALLVVQFALSFVVLTTAALMTLSLYRLNTQDAGFDADGVLAVDLTLNFTNYATPQQVRDFGANLLDAVDDLPGVTAAGVTAQSTNANGTFGAVPFDIEGQEASDERLRPLAETVLVSEDYFRALGVPLLAGRMLSVDDDELSEPVTLVNRAFQATHFANGNAVGRRVSVDGGETWRTIVGVVGNMRAVDLAREEGAKLYVSFREEPARSISLLIKSAANADELGEAVTAAVHSMDPRQAVERVRTLEQIRSEWLAAPRLIASLIGALGALALLVTVSGVIGVVSYNVSQRVREVGIHMAIGATPSRIVAMFVGHGLAVFAVGLGVGIALMAVGASSLDAMLYRTSGFSATVYGAAALLLAATVLAALAVPSVRASRFDPSAALRNE